MGREEMKEREKVISLPG